MKTAYKILAGALALSFLASCDYEKINTNPFEMTDEMGVRDGVAIGGAVTAMERCVFPVGTQADNTDIINAYQTAFNLSADTWCGYFGQNNRWNSGQNNAAYYLVDSWCANTYTQTYTNLLPSWKKLKTEADKLGKEDWNALGNIIKISAWSKTLESFGPIPFTHAGEPALVIPADSEREVFQAIFDELEEAVGILTPFAGGKLFSEYDAVYAGDITKWVKYANSLMLRFAMRVSYADEEMARKYASMAINSRLGLMSDISEEAKMGKGAGLQFVNNIAYLADKYNEARMGVSILCYLNGYEDPRLEAYFNEADDDRYGLRGYNGKVYVGISGGSKYGQIDYYTNGSKPNFTSETPTYWMRASEICFLRAEAALRWGGEFAAGGSAEDWYKAGIAMSFDEAGVKGDVDAYLAKGTAPCTFSFYNNFSVGTSATTAFEGSTEQKLEKIAVQKWLALYPNGHEAWTEWRRTGYPKLAPVDENRGTGYGVTMTGGIRRMIYPASFRQSAEDSDNYNKTIELLGGTDSPVTQLWWDCKTRGYENL